MKLRSLLISALMNVCALCPAWASAHIIDDHQASSSASTSYFLKTLPNDILAHILTYVSGPSLHCLWEIGNKTMQQHLTKNVQAFDRGKYLDPWKVFFPQINLVSTNFLMGTTSRFPNIRELNVSYDWFSCGILPNEIISLTQLRVLSIGNCNLTTLPDNLPKLSSLTTLNAYGNKFTGNFLGLLLPLLKLNRLKIVKTGEMGLKKSNLPEELYSYAHIIKDVDWDN